MNVLCLKLRNRHAVWNPATSPPCFEDGVAFSEPSQRLPAAAQNGVLKGFRSRVKMKNSTRKMSPPLPVTEDTPPDMLAGAMDLHVVLPNGQDMKMSVERSTPMMDLLVQVTTANKISPGGHVIQAIGDRGILPYKPSTPIGALDTWTIHIVSKKQLGNMYLKKPLPKPANHNTPFEQTFRLQVNLPRNQLYVSRISYKTRLEDILCEVCKEKNLDQSKYCLIHPEKLDEELDLSKTFLDYKLQQVTLTSKSNRPVGLSSVDIMALKRYDNGNQHVNNKYYASHSYDGSVSSGSIEGRSLSPVRSDESSSSPTIPKTNTLLNRPFRKRRPAPKPPSMQNGRESKHVPDSLTISHSRNSSDSSGYHESSVLSESPESNSNSLADSLPRRSKLPTENPSCSTQHSKPNSSSAKIGSNLSRSLSNLAVIGNRKKSTTNMLSNGMRRKEFSASSVSLASIPGRKKKAPAPPPPLTSKSLLSLKEEDVVSEHIPTPASTEAVSKSQTLPATAKISHDAELPCSNSRLQNTVPEPVSSCTVDSCSVEQSPPVGVDSVVSTRTEPESTLTKSPKLREKELTMDDEEIDRIFNDATKDYESPSLSTLPSPPESFTSSQLIKNGNSLEDPYSWEYKLPSPPQAFRDHNSSPVMTEYDTVTISNLTDVIKEKRLSIDDVDRTDVITKNLKNSLYNEEFNQAQSRNSSTVILNADPYSSEQPSRLPSQPPKSASSTSPHMKSFDIVAHTQFNGYDAVDRSAENESMKSRSSPDRKSRTFEQKADACEKLNLSCDKSSFIDVNYMSTNDSGLGSDDSIPSVSEGRSGLEDAGYVRKTVDTKVPERRGSTLQNFTITTYQNSNSKPTEIFHDDSVKTSRTTLLAKNNRPFVKTSDENNVPAKSSSLMRHSSFNTEKTPNSMVKRSKSHISLLSGNFTKFNRLGKFNVKSHVEETDSRSSSPEMANEWIDSQQKAKAMPSTTSHLRRTISEVSINKDSNKDGDELLELQDQVMKWKENERKSCFLRNGTVDKVSELQSLQVLKDILPQINRPLLQDKQISSATFTRTTSTDDTCSSTNRFKVEIKPRPSVDHGPTVNLQSWNERPKRQVSIKTDRDYVFGNNRRTADRNHDSCNGQPNCGTDDTDGHVKSSADLSRVPIVRAVEFKKPFAQRVAVGDLAQPCPVDAVRPESQRTEKETNCVEPKPRPSSFYLFGEHMLAGAGHNEPRGLLRASSELEMASQRINGARTSNSENDCGRVSVVTSCVSNSSAVPFKRKTITHVNGSAQRFSYTNGVNSDTYRTENYTFKTYKNKLIENEKLTNGYQNRVNGECHQNANGDDDRCGRNSVFKTYVRNEPEMTVTKSSGGIPPPPPVMPSLRPVSQKTSGKTFRSENPRDVLLSSIKNFNRDNLRKLRVK